MSRFADGKDLSNSLPEPISAPTTSPGPKGVDSAKRSKTFAAVAKSAAGAPTALKPKDLRRIFVRLDENHPARSASPYAIRQVLRDKLGETVASLIHDVSRVQSGLAILPQTPLGEQILNNNVSGIQKALEGSHVDVEDKWAVFVIPDVPRSYTAFDKDPVVVTEETALEEFKIQVPGVQPIKFYWSKKSTDQTVGTLVVAVSEAEAGKIPFKIQLFSHKTIIKRKHAKITLERCDRCWDMHNPRNCTRTSRCRLCASTAHLTADHPAEDNARRCCNCDGPHPADHTGCSALPRVERGQVVRPSRSQVKAMRKIGARERQRVKNIQLNDRQDAVSAHSMTPSQQSHVLESQESSSKEQMELEGSPSEQPSPRL